MVFDSKKQTLAKRNKQLLLNQTAGSGHEGICEETCLT